MQLQRPVQKLPSDPQFLEADKTGEAMWVKQLAQGWYGVEQWHAWVSDSLSTTTSLNLTMA